MKNGKKPKNENVKIYSSFSLHALVPIRNINTEVI